MSIKFAPTSTRSRLAGLAGATMLLAGLGVVLAQPAQAGSAFGCTTHAAYPYRHDVTEVDYSGSVTCTSNKYALVVTITNEYFKHTSDTNPTWTGPIPKHTCGYGDQRSCSVSSKNQPFFGAGEYCTVTQAQSEGDGSIPAARTCTTY